MSLPCPWHDRQGQRRNRGKQGQAEKAGRGRFGDRSARGAAAGVVEQRAPAGPIAEPESPVEAQGRSVVEVHEEADRATALEEPRAQLGESEPGEAFAPALSWR